MILRANAFAVASIHLQVVLWSGLMLSCVDWSRRSVILLTEQSAEMLLQLSVVVVLPIVSHLNLKNIC